MKVRCPRMEGGERTIVDGLNEWINQRMMFPMTALVKSVQLALPPRSPVKNLPSARVRITEFSIAKP